MRIVTLCVVMVLSAVVCSPDIRADELKLKDGSTVVGKLIKEIPGQSYRMLVSDGSEIVYPAEKVESVSLNEKGNTTATPVPSSGTSMPSASVAAPVGIKTVDMVSGGSKHQGHAKPATFGVGIGKYGIVGAELHSRPADRVGFSVGLGVWAYDVTITETSYNYYYDYYNGSYSYETTQETKKSGSAAVVGIKEHIYFTDRDKPSQHGLFLYQAFSDGFGPAFGAGYNYEHYFRSGMGLNAAIGLVGAPSVNEYLAEKLEVDEDFVDVTWIPLLFELGFTF